MFSVSYNFNKNFTNLTKKVKFLTIILFFFVFYTSISIKKLQSYFPKAFNENSGTEILQSQQISSVFSPKNMT